MAGTGRTPTSGDRTETVRAFLRHLEEKDIDSWIELWAEDAHQYYPYGTEMFPHHIRGRDNIYERWRQLPDTFVRLRFPVREIWSDGDTVLARFNGHMVRADGQTYDNTYLGIFKFTADGRVREYWEYFDPIRAGVAFGLAEVTYLQR